MRVLILGLGSSGGGAEAAEYYLKLGHSVEIIGSSENRENERMIISLLESKGAVFVTKDMLMDAVEKAELVVKVPGVPVPYLVKKKAKHIICMLRHIPVKPRDRPYWFTKTEQKYRNLVWDTIGKQSGKRNGHTKPWKTEIMK